MTQPHPTPPPAAQMDLLAMLNDVQRCVALDGPGWNQLIRLLRQGEAMSKFTSRVRQAGLMDQLETAVADHLAASEVVARQHARAVRWETNRIAAAMTGADYDLVFLKGGAYVLAGLRAGQGRLISDVDIMTPKAHLLDAEQRLLHAGWTHIKLDEYDQRYYRQWMHELPPLKHKDRRNVLDLHHTILPETGRLHPDPAKLFAAAIPIPGLNHPRLKMLAPIDMICHSAAHLFQDGDLAGGLRDLLDLDDLLRHFGEHEPSFWQNLIPRARELDLQRPLFYALRFSADLLHTPIPDEVVQQSKADGPGSLGLSIMDALAHRAIVPQAQTSTQASVSTQIAQLILYIRSHWLRMPPTLLTQHLFRKAWRRTFDVKTEKVHTAPRTNEERNVQANRPN